MNASDKQFEHVKKAAGADARKTAKSSGGRQAVLIFPHQLFLDHFALEKNRLVVLAEDWLFFRQFPFHRQKLILHRASMKAFEERLKKLGHDVLYIESAKLETTDNIFDILEAKGIKKVHIIDTADEWLEQFLDSFASKHDMELVRYETNMFLTPRAIIGEFFKSRPTFSMADYYIYQRKRFNVLVLKNGEPVGGKWMTGARQRRLAPDIEVPPVWKPDYCLHVREAIAYVERNFPNNHGMVEPFFYPVTHEDARLWLKDFLEHRLANFGFYRDAIKKDELVIFHSVLSPLLNIGLLTPRDVIKAALEYAASAKVPLESLESFFRQVMGWREFIYANYLLRARADRSKNVFEHTRKMPKIFWNGSCGIEPVDTAIQKMLYFGYISRADRLLSLGYFFLLCEIDPDEIYRLMMSLSIDAYDWVMAPNIYGMLQADSDFLIANKTYFSGSRYLIRMSDYKAGEWSEIWDALHWRFVRKHEEAFRRNRKLNFAADQLKEIDPGKLRRHLDKAEKFLARLKRN